MTDKKLTKVLECCANDDCSNCPTQVKQCRQHAMLNALDLIKSQKAEIEEHRRVFETIHKETKAVKVLYTEDIGKARAEAIKEFAERLKEKRGHDFPFTGTVFVEEIEDLVKEMTEETKHD